MIRRQRRWIPQQPVWLWVCMLILTGLLLAPRAHAEWTISLYSGWAHTLDSDVTLTRPEGTDLTFHDVSWEGESFEHPIYFGLRVAYWLPKLAQLGFALDFTHAKMVADLDKEVRVTGTRSGVPVDAIEPLSATFDEVEFSHGHNLLTANVLYRLFPKGARDRTFLGRLQPYAGLGVGVAIPHIEVSDRPFEFGEFQLAGPAFQGLVGVNVNIVKHVSFFTEFKASYARLDGDLNEGGSIETNPWTLHVTFGIALNSSPRS